MGSSSVGIEPKYAIQISALIRPLAIEVESDRTRLPFFSDSGCHPRGTLVGRMPVAAGRALGEYCCAICHNVEARELRRIRSIGSKAMVWPDRSWPLILAKNI